METIVSTPMKAFVKDSKITSIQPVVKKNTNGYPFITVLRGSEPENLYFSKNSGADLGAGQSLTKEDFSKMNVVTAKNAAGEERTKLTFNSYVDAESLFD